MKRIGVLANCGKPDAPAVLRRLAERARALGFELVTCDETATLLGEAVGRRVRHFRDQIDVLLALGGDGTMLHAVRLLDGVDVPVLGVNLGSLGFLTSVAEEHMERALDALAQGTYSVSDRSVAECRLIKNGREAGSYRALNDVVIGWGASSRVVTLRICLDQEEVGSYRCDGLIVSTPTGSTGHSLSGGGPILHPEAPVFVINPICPHTLGHRPLVVSNLASIVIEVKESVKQQLLVVDGQEQLEIEKGDRVEIRKTPAGIRFIHMPGYSYFALLRQKLQWRGSYV